MSIQALTLQFDSGDPVKPAAPLYVTTTDELHGSTETIVRGGEPTARRIARVIGLEASNGEQVPLAFVAEAIRAGRDLTGWTLRVADRDGSTRLLPQAISSVEIREASGVYA